MHLSYQHIIFMVNKYSELKHKRPLIIRSVLNYSQLLALAGMNVSILVYFSLKLPAKGEKQSDNKGIKSLGKQNKRTGEGKVDQGWISQVKFAYFAFCLCVCIDYVGKVVESRINYVFLFNTFQTYALLDSCHGEYLSFK